MLLDLLVEASQTGRGMAQTIFVMGKTYGDDSTAYEMAEREHVKLARRSFEYWGIYRRALESAFSEEIVRLTREDGQFIPAENASYN